MRHALVAVLIAVLAAVGCSSDDGSDKPQDSAPQAAPEAQPAPHVGAYVEAWEDHAPTLVGIDQVQISFGVPQSDGSVLAPDFEPVTRDVIVQHQRENPDSELSLAIGGWGTDETHDSILEGFRAGARDPQGFADEVLKAVQTVQDRLGGFKITGIDLDWEYPNAAEALGLVDIVQALRDRDMTVSLAVSGDAHDNGNGVFTVADQLAPLLSHVRVMTYDNVTPFDEGLAATGNAFDGDLAIEQVHTWKSDTSGAEIKLADVPEATIHDHPTLLTSGAQVSGGWISLASPAIVQETLRRARGGSEDHDAMPDIGAFVWAASGTTPGLNQAMAIQP